MCADGGLAEQGPEEAGGELIPQSPWRRRQPSAVGLRRCSQPGLSDLLGSGSMPQRCAGRQSNPHGVAGPGAQWIRHSKTYMIWARQPQKAYRSLTSDHLSHLLAADAVVELEVGPTVAIPQSPGGHLLHQPQPHGHMTVRLGGTKAQTWLQCGSRWVAVLEREAGPQPPQVPDSAACSAAATACRRLTRSTSHRGPASGRSLSPQGPNIQRTTVQCLPTLL